VGEFLDEKGKRKKEKGKRKKEKSNIIVKYDQALVALFEDFCCGSMIKKFGFT